jgi:hypothetical protein
MNSIGVVRSFDFIAISIYDIYMVQELTATDGVMFLAGRVYLSLTLKLNCLSIKGLSFLSRQNIVYLLIMVLSG